MKKGNISLAAIFGLLGGLFGYWLNNYLGEEREIERDLYRARLEAYQVFAEGQALLQHAKILNEERLRRESTGDGVVSSDLFSSESIDKVFEEANRNINRGKFLLAVTASDKTISTVSQFYTENYPAPPCEEVGIVGEQEIENYMAFRKDILRRDSDVFEDKRDLVSFLFNCTPPRTPRTWSTDNAASKYSSVALTNRTSFRAGLRLAPFNSHENITRTNCLRPCQGKATNRP